MIAAAALLLALAVPTFAQVNPTSPGISYAGCVATRPADLVASVPYSGVDACDIHCRESGYLYAWYIYDTPDGDCSCRLYGPTASEWEPTDNSDLLCADGQYSVDITSTSFVAPKCYNSVPDLNQGSIEGGPSQQTPVSVITRVSDQGACLRQCVNWGGANVKPDGDAYTCQCDDGASGSARNTGETTCTADAVVSYNHGYGSYTTNAPAGQSIWAKRSIREQIRLDAQRTAGKLCPDTARACLTSPGASTFECIETDDELESCGGCLYGEYGAAASLQSAATDCSAIEGVMLGGVTCELGRCVVSACDEGFSLTGNTCSAITVPYGGRI